MKKLIYFLSIAPLFALACFLTTVPAPPPNPPKETTVPVIPIDTPVVSTPEFISRPSKTTSTQTPDPGCETHDAVIDINTDPETIHAGGLFTVTVLLHNQGCVALGLPQYRLSTRQAVSDTVLAPATPEPIIHPYGVGINQTDGAVFNLTAVRAGEIELNASVSFEVHLGYPGPAYWGSASSGPVRIKVEP